jgi:predicted alpha/beta-fold hydrolase
MPGATFPPFQQHPFFRGGHAQTLAGAYLPYRYAPYAAHQHVIGLDDGDQLVLHDDQPRDWQNGDGACLVAHGLGGSYQSSYMRRVTSKLTARGVRVFRLDLRGFGAGQYMAIRPTHCGLWADIAAGLQFIARQAPSSPTALVGFSLSGTIALNLATELGSARCGNLAGVMAVSPPVDLHAVTRHFATLTGHLYDRQFVRILWRCTVHHQQRRLDMPRIDLSQPPRRLRDFDDLVTAPLSGFASADDYYTRTSPGPRLRDIRIPTLILAAEDDPIVPMRPLAHWPRSDAVEVVMTPHGGHLGYIARAGLDSDRRWMDWRVVEWVCRTIIANHRLDVATPHRQPHKVRAESPELARRLRDR